MKRFLPAALLLCAIQISEAAPKAPTPKAPTHKPPAKAPAKTPAKPSAKPPARPPVEAPPAEHVAPQPPPLVEPVVTGPKTWALLVGVSKYQNPQISSLRYPAVDAKGLRDALLDRSLGGLMPEQVRLLTDDEATRDNITGAVDNFLRPNVKPGDKVIVFLAGHGVAKGVGLDARSFLLPSDVRGLTTASLENSAVNLRELANSLGELPASQFVVFVDACREDPTPGRGIKGNTLTDVFSRGIQVVPQQENAESATFFACSVGQRAYEDPKLGHGVFTNWILEGIREGAVPQKPDGAVDMGRLSSYVSQKVNEWAKATSANGDFEVEQTPELVATRLSQPLVLLRVKRPLSDTAFAPAPPKLLIAASPEAAQVTINGRRAGTGVVEQSLPSEGEYTVTISAPGYAPAARSVKAMGGYEHQVVVQLVPTTAGGAAPATDDPAAGLYKRAMDAEAREQWEVAEQGYNATIATNLKFFAAYEALYELHQMQNRNIDAIADAQGLLANAPRGAHPLSLLSRAYSRFAEKGAGVDNVNTTLRMVNGYGLPRTPDEAAQLAQRAANEALAVEPGSAEAGRAQGYALAALDLKGKNKRAALAAFGKATFADNQDAANHIAMGYGIRYYAVQLKKDDDRRTELRRAVAELQEAVKLRPDSYDAHRELGNCYTLLDETDNALREYELANAHRGAASDANEVAGNEVAMAGLHMKAASTSTGEEKTAHEQASNGYMADAKETSPDLKVAMNILSSMGISTSLATYMPAELRPLMDVRGTVEEKVREKVKLPGGIRLPF